MIRSVLLKVDSLTRPARELLLRVAIRFSTIVRLDDFEVVDWTGSGTDLHKLSEKINDALRLIRLNAPDRYQHLRTHVKRFLLTEVSGPEYVHGIRACMLNPRYILEHPIEQLAATIIHEGTHARLCALGVRYGPSLRAQIEELCVGEEVAFLQRLGNTADLVARTAEKLNDPWWSEEEELNRRLRQLEELGRPRWYRRLYAFLWDPRR